MSTAKSDRVACPPRRRRRHGKYLFLRVGRQPKGAAYIGRELADLRRETEAAVLDRHGSVSILGAALIQSATRHEGRARLLQRYMRSEGDLPLHDRIQLLREISAASDSRDKCLERLGLTVAMGAADVFAIISSRDAIEPGVSDVDRDGDNASGDAVGDGA